MRNLAIMSDRELLEMSDRDLLGLAARAAGYDYRPTDGTIVEDGSPRNWDPLTADSDALRLAAACNMNVYTDGLATVSACASYNLDRVIVTQRVSECGEDKSAAIRRAIVRAAAEIAAANPATMADLLDEIDALRAELQAWQWQPIETAPKDGTRVLLRIEWSDVPVVGVFSHDRWWADTEHHEVSCGAYCYGGRVSSDKNMKPTHWHPLPLPPDPPKEA